MPSENSATRQWMTLGVVCLAILIIPLGISGTSVALPEIGTDLDADLVPLQWVVNSYNVIAASLMMAVGSLADRLGRRRVFAAGTSLYAVSLVAAAFAENIYVLDIARGVAGLGATGIMTGGTAILAASFDGPARARAFSVLGVTIGAGLALGPSTSGWLIGLFGWRAVFAAHLIIVVVSLLGLPLLKESRGPVVGRIDWAGTVTFTASLVLFTLVIIEGPQFGWLSGPTLALLAGSLVFLALFILVERRQSAPMFDLGLFLHARFVSANLLNVGISVGFVSLLVVVPAYLTAANGASTAFAGTVMLLMTGPILVVPLLAGRLVQRGVAPHTMLSAGMLVIAAGCAWLTVLHPGIGTLALAGPLVAIGVGMSCLVGLLDGAAVSTVPAEKAGMAAGMFNTVRLASEALAVVGVVALVVSVVRGRVGAGLADYPENTRAADEVANSAVSGDVTGLPDGAFRTFLADAHTTGMRTALWACAVFCVAAALLAHRLLREPEPAVTPSTDPAVALQDR